VNHQIVVENVNALADNSVVNFINPFGLKDAVHNAPIYSNDDELINAAPIYSKDKELINAAPPNKN
jgi:hypothetical protein